MPKAARLPAETLARELAEVTSPRQFSACLDRLKAVAQRSLRDIAKNGGISPTTAHALTLGSTAPTERSVSGFLTGCGLHPADQQPWLLKYRQLYPGSADRRAAVGTPPLGAAPGPGRLIRQCDPFDLEVHPAIEVAEDWAVTPPLPAYLPRAHDTELRAGVDAAVAGDSRLMILVGGSATGKTRACWEAVQRLPDAWRVWHPLDPTRPEAAAHGLAEVGPRTVVWLNEAHHYLLPYDPGLGERIAAGLRSLITDAARGPVLVLGTLWPEYWELLNAAPEVDQYDFRAQTRVLLHGRIVPVPDGFTRSELNSHDQRTDDDPRLRRAVRDATNGRVTQYLAGVPMLLERYETAGPVARAVIHTAMDLRRLGHAPLINHGVLASAVPHYLDEAEWHQAARTGWDKHLAGVLHRLDEPARGVEGLLTRVRTRRTPDSDGTHDAAATYRLAEYLDHLGRRKRADICPPGGLWEAAVLGGADKESLHRLGDAARDRGRFHRAAYLYQQAGKDGSLPALAQMVLLLERAGDAAGAESYALLAVEQGSPDVMRDLAVRRERAGDSDGAVALYELLVSRGDNGVAGRLARVRRRTGPPVQPRRKARHANTWKLREEAERLLWAGNRADAEVRYRLLVEQGDVESLGPLLWLMEQRGDLPGAERLASEAADGGEPAAMLELAQRRRLLGDVGTAGRLFGRLADMDVTTAMCALAMIRDDAGDRSGALTFAHRAADLGDTGALRDLAMRTGPTVEGESLRRRAAELGDDVVLIELADLRDRAGDPEQAEAYAVEAAECGRVDALLSIARRREAIGDLTGAENFYRQAASRGSASALRALARCRDRVGDPVGAKVFALHAADHGGADVLEDLAIRREHAGELVEAEAYALEAEKRDEVWLLRRLFRHRVDNGDQAGAEGLAWRAADRGDPSFVTMLAAVRREAGDHEGADELARQLAERALRSAAEPDLRAGLGEIGAPDDGTLSSSTTVQWGLAKLLEAELRFAEAETAYRRLIDRGVPEALTDLIRLRQLSGDESSANRIRRFGLTDDGTPADGTGL